MGWDFDTPVAVKVAAAILAIAALIWMGVRIADSGASKQEVQEARAAHSESH